MVANADLISDLAAVQLFCLPLRARRTSSTPAAGAAVRAARAGGSLLITAVFARPLPVPVIKRVTEPARRQNASKCH
jgi:hypothetical protein